MKKILKRLGRSMRRAVSFVVTDVIGSFFARLFSKKLRKQLLASATDEFLDLLLDGMDLAFDLSRGYRKNIRGFSARYVFRTADGKVEASASFDDGRMRVYREQIERPNVEVVFKDASAIWRYLLSKDQDILNSLLNNEVEVNGNLNYVYKFGFLARDLSVRLGVG